MKSRIYPDSTGSFRLRAATIQLRLRYLPRLMWSHCLLARRYTHRRRAAWIALAFGWSYMVGR